MITDVTEEADAINWYEQGIIVINDSVTRATRKIHRNRSLSALECNLNFGSAKNHCGKKYGRAFYLTKEVLQATQMRTEEGTE